MQPLPVLRAAAGHRAAAGDPRLALCSRRLPLLSLQALNSYADQLSQGLRPQAAKITFFVRSGEGEGLVEVRTRYGLPAQGRGRGVAGPFKVEEVRGPWQAPAPGHRHRRRCCRGAQRRPRPPTHLCSSFPQIPAELPPYGSLGPLFYAFGLITREELKGGVGAHGGAGADDRDLAAWLRETVAEAVRGRAGPGAAWLWAATHSAAACRVLPPQEPVAHCPALAAPINRTAGAHRGPARQPEACDPRHAHGAGGAVPAGPHPGACCALCAAVPAVCTSVCLVMVLQAPVCVPAPAPPPRPARAAALSRPPRAQVGGEFAISTAEQRRQIDALKALEGCLAALGPEAAAQFEGLSLRCVAGGCPLFTRPRGAARAAHSSPTRCPHQRCPPSRPRHRLYHPQSRPLGTVEYVDADGAFNLRTQPIVSFVADDGVVHIVADSDPAALAATLPRLDLRRARLLARLGTVWMQRSRWVGGRAGGCAPPVASRAAAAGCPAAPASPRHHPPAAARAQGPEQRAAERAGRGRGVVRHAHRGLVPAVCAVGGGGAGAARRI